MINQDDIDAFDPNQEAFEQAKPHLEEARKLLYLALKELEQTENYESHLLDYFYSDLQSMHERLGRLSGGYNGTRYPQFNDYPDFVDNSEF